MIKFQWIFYMKGPRILVWLQVANRYLKIKLAHFWKECSILPANEVLIVHALTEPVSFRFVRGGVGSFAFYIFIDKSLQLKVRSCDAYRDVVTLLKPLRCLFKLHVFCDLPLKKELAFKHLRTCIYLKWAPDKSPVILGISA